MCLDHSRICCFLPPELPSSQQLSSSSVPLHRSSNTLALFCLAPQHKQLPRSGWIFSNHMNRLHIDCVYSWAVQKNLLHVWCEQKGLDKFKYVGQIFQIKKALNCQIRETLLPFFPSSLLSSVLDTKTWSLLRADIFVGWPVFCVLKICNYSIFT